VILIDRWSIFWGASVNNNRIKTIPADGLDPNQIQQKVEHITFSFDFVLSFSRTS
jgi:hypothetical protein